LVFEQVKVLTVCQSKIANSEEGREIFFVFIVLLFIQFLHTIGFHSLPHTSTPPPPHTHTEKTGKKRSPIYNLIDIFFIINLLLFVFKKQKMSMKKKRGHMAQ
jgi:hypothetical protein